MEYKKRNKRNKSNCNCNCMHASSHVRRHVVENGKSFAKIVKLPKKNKCAVKCSDTGNDESPDIRSFFQHNSKSLVVHRLPSNPIQIPIPVAVPIDIAVDVPVVVAIPLVTMDTTPSLPDTVGTNSIKAPCIDDSSDEQRKAFQVVDSGQNLFLTGAGGTGKSRCLNFIVDTAIQRNGWSGGMEIVVCSTTGCSAVLLSSTIEKCTVKTIHSWSGTRLCKGENEKIIDGVMKNRLALKAWKQVKLLIIDEVSMLSKKMMYILDETGKRIRRNNRPFGGIQVVFVGDFYQLPPVGDFDDPESSAFCFTYENWDHVFPIENHVQLTRIYRQKDKVFQRILTEVRIGALSDECRDILQTYVGRTVNPELGIIPMKILPTRNQVDFVNRSQYEKVVGEEIIYSHVLSKIHAIQGKLFGALSKTAQDFEIIAFTKSVPAEDEIKFKVGVPVMCLINLDMDQGISNGSMGVIVDFKGNLLNTERNPVVRFTNGIVRLIMPHVWIHPEYPLLSISQLPLCLAYSSTIHKLQGSTLDMAEMNLGMGIFAEGQTYVGLSRVRSLDGLYLSAFHPKRIRVNDSVREFYSRFE